MCQFEVMNNHSFVRLRAVVVVVWWESLLYFLFKSQFFAKRHLPI